MPTASDQMTNPAAIAFLVEQTSPFEAGSVAVSHDGTMSRRDKAVPIRFGFRFAGRTFEAEVRPADGKLRAHPYPAARHSHADGSRHESML